MEHLSNTHIAFLGYMALMIVLLLILAQLRVRAALSGKAANKFSPTGEDLGPFSVRLCRAHANVYEFFPLYGGLLLYAMATGQMAVTNGLALVLLGARVLQSLTHVLSTSHLAVQIRFLTFLIQVFILIYWTLKLFGIF